MQVYRCYVEKREGFDGEARALGRELRELVGLSGLTGARIFKRYDVEGLDAGGYARAREQVFRDPAVDEVYDEALPPVEGLAGLIPVEALPGQFDQRADSAAQCVQLLMGGERPRVRCATVYALLGRADGEELGRARRWLINPVECREASMDKPQTLRQSYPEAAGVAVAEGFNALDGAGLEALRTGYGLAMDAADLRFLQDYFREEGREPTLTELRVVDTYWSDHCRHTTFSTHLEGLDLQDREVAAAYRRYLELREEVYGPEKAASRPVTLMDIATIGAKTLKKRGLLPELDESEEINACSIRVPAAVTLVGGGEEAVQDWLLMFKNETHNHPTEIEPFGGAATCIGGCIRDPLSGRAYVHQAMRVTGSGDPRTPLDATLPGKLPQRRICQAAAAGYSSYGNQIGLATGLVDEMYHPGYVAKRLECGVVVGAAPAENVVRETPAPGDVVLLLGGRTGRDGIGGATGSSKSHDLKSLDTMASEVQKGNAPEERKLQRLFRNRAVTRLIKRCNDFGAGGVSVAIGELADGLAIDLDAVRKKYDGLDGTELAISESQERMAVVVAPENAEALMAAAAAENLEAYPVAVVTQEPRMVMTWRGQKVADLSRAFLNTNGAPKDAGVSVPEYVGHGAERPASLRETASSLRCASRRGLAERFDSTIGAGSVLAPFGGREQRTPAQVMAALFPVGPEWETEQASVMAYGCDPETLSANPYRGAYDAVTLSLAKLVAAGADYKKAYLTLQEFFEKLRDDPRRWGKPFSALLGALDAQMDYGCAAIGGKDSMSGSFLELDVPPTLISFAIAPIRAGEVLSPEFKEPGHPVYRFRANSTAAGQRAAWEEFGRLRRAGKIKAAWAVEHSLAEAVMKMSFGNRIGFRGLGPGGAVWYRPKPGTIVAELTEDMGDSHPDGLWAKMGVTTAEPFVTIGDERVAIDELLCINEGVLEEVYPNRAPAPAGEAPGLSWAGRAPIVAKSRVARPRVVIPVFPGTNCEYDSQRACLRAGLLPQPVVVRNLTPQALAQSARELEGAIRGAQILFLPGGFSGGDEPDGAAKFICSLLRNGAIADAVQDLLKNRDGLMLGICNGFQALVKLGLIPWGEIREPSAQAPALTGNTIGRHQSRYVRTRVASVRSPWMLRCRVGEVYTIPISHGEGRFVCPAPLLKELEERGQVATQYVDAQGRPSLDIRDNPNGSAAAIEGVFSPDGRVFGKMGHTERRGPWVGVNIPGEKGQPILEGGAEYYR